MPIILGHVSRRVYKEEMEDSIEDEVRRKIIVKIVNFVSDCERVHFWIWFQSSQTPWTSFAVLYLSFTQRQR